MTASIDPHNPLQGVQAEEDDSSSIALRRSKSTYMVVNKELTPVPFLLKNGLFIRALRFVPVNRAGPLQARAEAAGVSPQLPPAANLSVMS